MAEKVMNFFWGNENISWLRYMTLYSFRKYNPDWDIILYKSNQIHSKRLWDTIEKQDYFEYSGKDYNDKIKDLNIIEQEYSIKNKIDKEISPNQESDFFRWKIMSTTGGFYSDMDIIYTRNIEDLYLKTKEYDIGITFTSYYSIGLIFSNGKNKFFEDVYNECINNFDNNNYQGAGVRALDKWPIISDIEKNYGKVYNIPFDLLYQYHSNVIPLIYQVGSSFVLKPDSIGLHWYAGHPLSQNTNSAINENNYFGFDNLLGRTLKKVLD